MTEIEIESKNLKVVSMVPSWTETLLNAGVQVVGRTGFCVEPQGQVANIPVVGGTKNISWKKIEPLSPDIVVLDKEENPKSMAESCPYPYVATHVESVFSMPEALGALAVHLGNQKLAGRSEEWLELFRMQKLQRFSWGTESFSSFPGIIEWWELPKSPIQNVLYLIWKDPWMRVASNTFIGSVLSFLGLSEYLGERGTNRYPEVDLKAYDPKSTLLLFSSEPYNFAPLGDEMRELGFPCALVDGGRFSWFGDRSLKFLQEVFGKKP